MSAAVNAVLEEIANERAVFEPQLEGLRDFARLNLEPGTAQVVQERTAIYERRLLLLGAAEQAVKSLDADGHPGITVAIVEGAVFNDLSNNVSTIGAAFNGFDPKGQAVSATVTFGTPVGG